MTTHGTGMCAGERVSVECTNVESNRQLIRVEQAKQRKDHITLSPVPLSLLSPGQKFFGLGSDNERLQEGDALLNSLFSAHYRVFMFDAQDAVITHHS